MQNSDLPKANSSASQLLLHPVLSKRKGQKLSLKVQSQMESFFNSSFEEVRIHIGPEAASIGAIAFACGTELYFAPGYYQPETKEGLQLLGHELTHIIQQREGRVKNPFGTGIAIVQDELLEAEADQMGFGVTYSPWLNQPLCGKQKSTIDTLSIFSKGVDGPQGNVIQCVLEAYKSAVQGSKGA